MSMNNNTIEDTITVLQDYAEEKALVKSKAEKKPRQTGYTRRPNHQQQTVVSTSPSSVAPVTQTNNGGTTRRANKMSRSRTSTPQPEIETPTRCGNSLFEHFSQSARESSPPAKIRLPSHRMSIPDMNRRANQILEYICSMQVELATSKRKREEETEEDEETENINKRKLLDAQISEAMTKAAMQLEREEDNEDGGKENRRPTPILIPGKFDHSSSPSSSLSSASTIPLDDDRLLGDDEKCNNNEKSVAEEALERANKPKSEQSSMEIMDILTREVITFQRRFGSLCYGNNMDEQGDESDGPVTRSREINHNNRSMIVDGRW
ncbi:unnamed protein product [Mucor hiemalis]